jgi:hypothetical protein
MLHLRNKLSLAGLTALPIGWAQQIGENDDG